MDFIINFDKSDSKALLREHLRSLKGEYVIKIVKKSKVRSVQINKYYWGVVLKYISDFTGASTDYLHEVFKFRFIPEVNFSDDFLLSTSDLTNEECWNYITKIREFALNELSINIPDSDGVLL